ncbi:hypothetical protein [Alkalihalobacillus pseudalcaliphilus]|uniref:hypothetical protein n=1 Tax=Alkalihalobacillus pseudalcaliphilus TaxID=79884 RepID=UPI00064DCCD6|nr:hypothetical protein [Alkalihalobacillus pseudalcaliphilus]KMK78007.1 membrane protein [Alkalihalobacillus pseudalcaliphilus]
MVTASRLLKAVAGGLEAFWGIPLLGGLIIFGTGWAPLMFMLAVHIIGLVLAMSSRTSKAGHLLGIITSIIGIIPIVGMIMHMITALVLIIETVRGK